MSRISCLEFSHQANAVDIQDLYLEESGFETKAGMSMLRLMLLDACSLQGWMFCWPVMLYVTRSQDTSKP